MPPEITGGVLAGLGLALLGWLITRGAVGREPLQYLARFTGAFLLKLMLVTLSLILLSRSLEKEQLVRFAVSLLAVYMLGIGAQLALYTMKLRRGPESGPHTRGTKTE